MNRTAQPASDPIADIAALESRVATLERKIAGLIDHIEDLEDEIALLRGGQGDPADRLPAEAVARLADGEHPVTVWRAQRDLTGKALAEASGVTPSYLSEIENGKKPGSAKALSALAAALGVAVEDLAPLKSKRPEPIASVRAQNPTVNLNGSSTER